MRIVLAAESRNPSLHILIESPTAFLVGLTPMFSIFTLAIKFDCLFLTIFQSFHLFVGFIFDKLAPPPEHLFQKMF